MDSIAILGNIGSGKSELAASLGDALGWVYVPEPVSLWRDSGFLQAYYDAPKRYAFTFQCYAFITRMNSYSKVGDVNRVYDSHLVSDRVFARTQVQQGNMTEAELGWYNATCDGWEKEVGRHEADIYVYLELDPAICKERIDGRQREEEAGIPLEYLSQIDQGYKALVDDLSDKGDKVVRIDASLPRQRVLELAMAAYRAKFCFDPRE